MKVKSPTATFETINEKPAKKTDKFDSVARKLLETEGNMDNKKRFMGVLHRYTAEIPNAASTCKAIDVTMRTVHTEITDDEESILFGLDIPSDILKNESKLLCQTSGADLRSTFVKMFENTIIPELSKLNCTDDKSTTIKIRSISIQTESLSEESSELSPEKSIGKNIERNFRFWILSN